MTELHTAEFIDDENHVVLPPGWAYTTIGAISQINPRNPQLRDLSDNLTVTFVPMAAVNAEHGTIETPEEFPLRDVRKGYTPFSDGDVIFAKITPCMENGKAALAINLKNGLGFGSTEFHVLSPAQDILPQWLFYFVRQIRFREDAKARFTGTAGQLRVPVSFLETYPIPLAPLNEQRRIVESIDAQFTRLDAGIDALKRLQANLKRYKASVLKSACEGKLVPQDPNDEPASALLARILKERREKWETEQIKKYEALGKNPPKDWREKYPEPVGPNTGDLVELPEGWVWASIEQLSAHEPRSITDGPFGSNLKTEHYREQGVRVIRLQNIGDGIFLKAQPGLQGATSKDNREGKSALPRRRAL